MTKTYLIPMSVVLRMRNPEVQRPQFESLLWYLRDA